MPRACSRSTPPRVTTTHACSPSSTSSSRIALPGFRLADRLPEILRAGSDAGRLTAEGAALLDPSGRLLPGAPLCPPEGDAGTGMVATNSVSPRSANVSVGTSIFAMVVLDEPLAHVHDEIDLVTTPAGDPVAMVHCNNGASELGAWAGLFGEFARRSGRTSDATACSRCCSSRPRRASPTRGGLLAYNYLSGRADHRTRRGPAARHPHAGLAPHPRRTSCAPSCTAYSRR